MRKRKNKKQEEIFVRFMKDHTDLARGFSKGDKISQEQLWKTIVEELNCAGPPTKDLTEWKKTWMDWKSNVKRKLSHNKKEVNHTGGGNFNQYILSQLEEDVALISGLYQTVDGIKNTKSFGKKIISKSNNDEEDCLSLLSVDSAHSSLSLPADPSTSIPRKTKQTDSGKNSYKKVKTISNLENFMENESYHLESIAQKIEHLSQVRSEGRSHISNKLENIGNKLEQSEARIWQNLLKNTIL